jgi:hypothetical protein
MLKSALQKNENDPGVPRRVQEKENHKNQVLRENVSVQ